MPTCHQRNGSVLRDAALAACVVGWVGSVFALFPSPVSPAPSAWPDALWAGCAAASAVLSLARWVPAQNIVAVAGMIGLAAGGLFGTAAWAGGPAAPLVYSESLGPALSGRVPWVLVLIWLVILLTARGVALLIVRPARERGRYGFWLMAVTVGLAVGVAAGLELMATRVKFYWRWQGEAAPWNWNGLVWPGLALWMVAALAFQVLALPWLVSKRPVVPAPDWHPLVVWFLINLWIMAGTSTRGWLAPAALVFVMAVLTTALALRGGLRPSGAGSLISL
ncbi:MAG: carotenoid biosynthesis protein [Verrucomicrobia bacterium]|nr:carotenoid biosynthesis protein [Verrucomicrobiota bacterium]